MLYVIKYVGAKQEILLNISDICAPPPKKNG